MQRFEVSGAVRPIYGSLGVKRLKTAYISLSDNVARQNFLSLSLSLSTPPLPSNPFSACWF